MMRRCVNEALTVARHRVAFGKAIIEHPLLRRQLMKLMVPAEQALSMTMAAAAAMGEADAGSAEAAEVLRILTPLVKFRACRDNVTVATGAMEVRGGNGYIEEWVNARLIRDAQVGLLWEGTSNINALDVIGRAIGKSRAHKPLETLLRGRLKETVGLPATFMGRLEQALSRALQFAERVARGRPLPSRRPGERRRPSIMPPVRCCWPGRARTTRPTPGARCWPAACWSTVCRPKTHWSPRRRPGKLLPSRRCSKTHLVPLARASSLLAAS